MELPSGTTTISYPFSTPRDHQFNSALSCVTFETAKCEGIGQEMGSPTIKRMLLRVELTVPLAGELGLTGVELLVLYKAFDEAE